MTAAALRIIEADLTRMALDSDPINHDEVALAARRIAAQAEMLERGINP